MNTEAMTEPQLADELAKIVPWLVHVGSIDDLVAIIREKLPGVMIAYLHDYSDTNPDCDPRIRCEASVVRLTNGQTDGVWIDNGKTMWSALARSVLVAARTILAAHEVEGKNAPNT